MKDRSAIMFLASQQKLALTIRIVALTLGSKSRYFWANNKNNLAQTALQARKGLCYRAALHKKSGVLHAGRVTPAVSSDGSYEDPRQALFRLR
jgi:hypothetical protein